MSRELPDTAFAFKGYNIQNLGRSPELLAHPVYGPFMERFLRKADEIGENALSRPFDLVDLVRREHVECLEDYPESILLVLASEMAQMEILREVFGVEIKHANMAYGFSLGELVALSATGVLDMADAVTIPLKMAEDAVDLARHVTLGVLFSRSGKALDRRRVHDLCTKINAEGKGVIDVSTYLSPNSMLLLGQGNTLKVFKSRLSEVTEEKVALRMNNDKWPPLHTSIVWQRHINSRSQMLMQQIQSGFTAPNVPLFSMATADFPYDGTNTRNVVGRWIDQPQHLWDAVGTTLSRGVKTVIHVGPAPNIIPATFTRLAANVEQVGSKTLTRMARRKWLRAMLPKRAALLNAPNLKHIILEDWLLEQEIS